MTKVEEEKKKAHTDWTVFDKGQIYPRQVRCQDYLGADGSCHSNLQVRGQDIVNHMHPDHGSNQGFEFELRYREGAKTNLWKELAELGVEIHDFRCDICDEQMPLTPSRIIKHTQPHAGKSRAARSGGKFRMTLRFNTPEHNEDAWGDE